MNDKAPRASGETYFFRDHGQFDLLRLRLLPELIERRRGTKTLRLWSAGCASGEEAYSLAMLVDMLLPERDGWEILILGSDIDQTALAKARHGHYGQWSFRMVPPALQQRYFRHNGEEWALDERIRRMVTFRAVDLIGEPFPGGELRDMDLILCRNVFIYFDPAAVFAVAAKFAATLREEGYLMTGHTELIGHPVRELVSRLFAEGVVYQRRIQAPAPLPGPPPHAGEGVKARSAGEAPSISPPPHAGETPFTPPPPYTGEAPFTPPPPHTGEAPFTPPPPHTGEIPNIPPPPHTGEAPFTPPPPHTGETLSIPPPPRAGEGWGGGDLPATPGKEDLLTMARNLADRGEYDSAEQTCRHALAVAPLAAEPYFMLAQLAQIRGDFERAGELLDKTLYLDPRCVAAYLEQAALCERAENLPRAQILRRAALDIVRALPGDAVVDPYETTAAEMAQWLAQWAAVPTTPAE